MLFTSSLVRYEECIPYLTSSELSVHPASYQNDIKVIGVIVIRAHSDTGRNLFHVRFIRWSYRIRGKVARTHTNRVARVTVSSTKIKSLKRGKVNPKNTILENRLITKILVYSAIKINANNPLLYSTLNPDTSSDSPSAKSNGVRFVSARFVMNQITARGRNITTGHENSDIFVKSIV